MTVGSGVGATLGTGIESVWGTGVAPTKWVEFETESIKWDANRTEGKGIYGGTGVPRGSNRLTTTASGAGTVKTPMYFKGMGQWLASLMGTLGTAPAQVGGTAAYLQTHALTLDNKGQSLSIQKGIPDISAGTIRPYTLIGAKVSQVQIEIAVDQFAYATWSVVGKDIIEASAVIPGAPTLAYTSPTYLTANPPFAWQQGTVLMGTLGSEAVVAGIRKLSMTIKRTLNTKRYYLDGTGRMSEPITAGFFEISGTLDTDYIDKTTYCDIYANNGSTSMILGFTGPTAIAASNFPFFKVATPQVFFGGETPTVGGPDLISPSIPFKAQYNDANNPCTITYQSTDVTL